MIGYINLNRGKLTGEEEEICQSYYCGLCRSLRKECGNKGHVIVNRDITFLILLLSGLYESEETVEEFVCPIHPTRKQLQRVNEITGYAAHMNILLAEQGLIEGRIEEQISKKTRSSLLQKESARISEAYPRQAAAIRQYMEKEELFNQCDEKNIDVAAGLRGEMLGELFVWKQDEWCDELKNMGFYMGKFIYLMKAYENLERDERRNLYNPVSCIKKTHERDYEMICRQMMTSMISECIRSFERLPILMHADVLRNILYTGIWVKYDEIQEKRGKSKRRQKGG